MTSSLLRHITQVISILIICHIISIYTIDTPNSIYHCPLDYESLSSHYTRTLDENCYWSTSYVEAREKFQSLSDALKGQLAYAQENGYGMGLDIVNVESISYDVALDPKEYQSLKSNGYNSGIVKKGEERFTSQTVLPGSNTVDALLLTIRLPQGKEDNNEEEVNVVHSSGTHGIEGYLGSAIQLRFLHELFLQQEKRLRTNNVRAPPTKNTQLKKVLLIHAINPYGMRHHRRTNENNVDLNRNVLSYETWKMIRARDPNFVSYVDMDSALNPFNPIKNGQLFSWVDAAREGGYNGDTTRLAMQDEKVKAIYKDSQEEKEGALSNGDELQLEESISSINNSLEEVKDVVQVLISVVLAVCQLGYTGTKRGLVAAQYHKPSGLSYGGGAHNDNTWESSIFAVQHAITSFAGFDVTDNTNGKTILIDVHTGLGKYGEYSILNKSTGSEFTSKLNSLLKRESNDASVSSGYDQSVGFIAGDVLCPLPNCHGLAQEFGTRPGVAVAVALIMENMGYNTGRRYNHLTSFAFNPMRLSWRRKALRGGMEMIHAILEGF